MDKLIPNLAIKDFISQIEEQYLKLLVYVKLQPIIYKFYFFNKI